MPFTIQHPCQLRKTAKNSFYGVPVGTNSQPRLGAIPQPRAGTFPRLDASSVKIDWKEFGVMFGKLAGAWLGNRLAGRNSGFKGAILGYGAASLARRSVPPPKPNGDQRPATLPAYLP